MKNDTHRPEVRQPVAAERDREADRVPPPTRADIERVVANFARDHVARTRARTTPREDVRFDLD